MKLKARVMAQAILMQAQGWGFYAAVRRSGDPDSGVILLTVDRFSAGVRVFGQIRDAQGRLTWSPITGDAPVPPDSANDIIEQEIGFDPDIWVLEIEDPRRIFDPMNLNLS